MWQASIFTLYPDMFPGPLGTSLSGEALKRGTWSLEAHQIRAAHPAPSQILLSAQ
jgi:tRNA (guanine37-N1)-methyltransferase